MFTCQPKCLTFVNSLITSVYLYMSTRTKPVSITPQMLHVNLFPQWLRRGGSRRSPRDVSTSLNSPSSVLSFQKFSSD